MTRPISFSVEVQSTLTPAEMINEFFEIKNWSDFAGWGPLPGIREAKFIEQPESRVGTRISVTNSDGSTHQETVVEYEPDRRLMIRLDDFSAPLKHLATAFIETWLFERRDNLTTLRRSFELHAKSPFTKAFLWLIGLALARAVRAHTRSIAGSQH